MRATFWLGVLCCVAAGVAAAAPSPVKKDVSYPATRVSDTNETLFGTQVSDPYRWLEDEKSPEVRAWMDAQDRVARDYLKELPGREALVKRLRDEYRADIDLEKLASELVIDAVVPSSDLRREVARRFERYAGKIEERPRKKHMVPPM